MFFLKKIILRRRQQKRIINERCDTYIRCMKDATSSMDMLFDNSKKYVNIAEVDGWKKRHEELLKEVHKINLKRFRRAQHYKELATFVDIFISYPEQLRSRIIQHNEKSLELRIADIEDNIGEVEGRRLDRQQLECIAEESDNQLVIAGAGTGKTTTIIGKIKYLLKSGRYAPEEILALSFTNASASEMAGRINIETNLKVDVMTFHKLGLSIITSVEGVKPKITKLNLHQFIKDYLKEKVTDTKYLRILNQYLIYSSIVAKSEFDFKTKSEYDDYLQINPPTTLNGEVVKSYGEMDIANFLFENNIKYIYEQPYKIDTRDDEHGQYFPDFYLPEYDIYIEYFGINRDHKVPKYFTGSHGKTAAEAYNDSIKWKRKLHQENQTTLIECYAYEKLDETLLQNLKEHLEKQKVRLEPLEPQVLWDKVIQNSNNNFDTIASLLGTIITLAKSNQYPIEYLRGKALAKSSQTLLSLVEPIAKAYDNYLDVNDEIDFNDMINRAAEYVQKGEYASKYRYIIVDEYQDISRAQYNLLKALRESKPYKLFCVGDDWQSIYRFNGSDIDYILNFERYWGMSIVNKIETTYRFPPQLAEISGAFVMLNSAQIRKRISSILDNDISAFGEINGYTDKYAIQFMFDKIHQLPQNSSIFLIGRYSFDVELIKTQDSIQCRHDNQSGMTVVNYSKRPDLKIYFLTAHKSKGLQADYVFIINNKNTKMGFPSKIQDHPILELLLNSRETFSFAEERRLFYVALTRAKKKTFIVTVKGLESEFVQELRARHQQDIKREKYECPMCGGRLVRRKGPYGEFFGCSNYFATGCKFKQQIHGKTAK